MDGTGGPHEGDGHLTAAQPTGGGGVRVLGPVRVRQLSAGLAVAAAVAALASIGTSLDRTRYTSGGETYFSTVRRGTGEDVLTGGEDTTLLAWVGPGVLAAVLLAAAAVVAIVSSRSDRPGAWGAAAQQLAAGAAGLLAVLTALLVVVGVSDVSAYRAGDGTVTNWGPAPTILAVATALAVAAALTARRGRAPVLATVDTGAAA